MKRKLTNDINKNNLLCCINLLDVNDDQMEGHDTMLYAFINNLDTLELKNMAVNLLLEEVSKLAPKVKGKSKRDISYNLMAKTIL